MYSNNLTEYEQKERTAAAEFISVVQKRTGLRLPGDSKIIPIDEVFVASMGSAKQIMRKIVILYKKKAEECSHGSSQQRRFLRYAKQWEHAISRM